MKTSKLINIAWVFFALVLMTTSVLAQGRGNENRYYQSQNKDCLSTISDLTEKQQIQIQEMENKHHEEMAALRTKRQSTTNAIEKSEIRTEMLKKVEAHRSKVKEILTAEQQKQYDLLHAYHNYGGERPFVNGQRARNLKGQGNGSQRFERGDVCVSNVNFRGRAGNYQRYFNCANGKGNNGNGRNHFRASNANYGRGYGNQNAVWGRGAHLQDSCTAHGSRNIDDEGFEVIE